VHVRKVPQQCCVLVDGIRCTKPTWTAGRCSKHRRELEANDPKELARIAQLSTDERERLFYFTANPPPPPWEYENPDGEAWLIRRQEYLDLHKNLPMFLTWDELDDLIAAEEQQER
jgi:hypothetical protein